MTLVTDPSAVDPADRGDGQQKSYLVLSEEERARGFVRPVRLSYRHVGLAGPQHPLRDLTPEEHARYGGPDVGFAKYEPYPIADAPGKSQALGRYWTQPELDSVGRGCGSVTTMGLAIAETYARSPGFYGGTFCVRCGKHFPVGARGEFVWEPDGSRVGT